MKRAKEMSVETFALNFWDKKSTFSTLEVQQGTPYSKEQGIKHNKLTHSMRDKLTTELIACTMRQLLGNNNNTGYMHTANSGVF